VKWKKGVLTAKGKKSKPKNASVIKLKGKKQ
jgi:hypothetical protein